MKTYVWGIPTRLFHWMLAICFVAAYILGEQDDALPWHIAIGLSAGFIAIFRIIYGFIGPRYSRFFDFALSLRKAKDLMFNYKTEGEKYVGHNPMASVVMLGIITASLLTAMSGLSLFLGKTGQINLPVKVVEEIHEVLASLTLLLVFTHVLGLLVDFIFHRKTGTLASMFSGFKNVSAEKSETSVFHQVYGVIALIITIAGLFVSLNWAQSNVDKLGELEEKHESYQKSEDEHGEGHEDREHGEEREKSHEHHRD